MTAHAPRLVLGVLAALTLVLSVGGAVGVWPTGDPASRWAQPAAAHVLTRDMEGNSGDVGHRDASGAGGDSGSAVAPPAAGQGTGPVAGAPDPPDTSDEADGAGTALPARSGRDRRVVFDMSEQRVWLVDAKGRVVRTYLVSGSRHANLDPGHYEVFSRSRNAVSYTYEETMEYMVRFAEGDNAAIGFHDIPVDRRGRPVQTREQLGQRLSSGCIRQAQPDAVALWRFADIGARVVVVR
jgi:lipoprotein-anchoring transpeptidase ErfK/SrfK